MLGAGRFVEAVDHFHEVEGLVRGVEGFGAAFEGFDEVGGGGDAAHVLAGVDGDDAVLRLAVFLDVELGDIDGGFVETVLSEKAFDFSSGFGALENDRNFLALDHLGPRHLEAEDLTGLEGDEAVSGHFHVNDAAFAIGNAPGAFEIFIADVVVESLADDMVGIRVAHEIHREIEHVEEVDDGTAAGQSLRREPAAEARNAGASAPFCLGGIDDPDGAVVTCFHHLDRFGAGPVVEVEHQGFSAFAGHAIISSTCSR